MLEAGDSVQYTKYAPMFPEGECVQKEQELWYPVASRVHRSSSTSVVHYRNSAQKVVLKEHKNMSSMFIQEEVAVLSLGVLKKNQVSSVSRSVVSNSLQPQEPQHARPPCPSPAPGVHPNSCPLSQ